MNAQFIDVYLNIYSLQGARGSFFGSPILLKQHMIRLRVIEIVKSFPWKRFVCEPKKHSYFVFTVGNVLGIEFGSQ